MPRSTLGGSDGGPGDPRGRVGGKREKRNKTKCLPEPLSAVSHRTVACICLYVRILRTAYNIIICIRIGKRKEDGEDRR
jgi:hypothetical protein